MTGQTRISPAFRARLQSLPAEQKVRAIVLLRTGRSGRSRQGRPARGERSRAVDTLRASAREGLQAVDEMLSETGGKRLTAQPDALGSIVVEATAAGIAALAELPQVETVFEDQPLSAIR